MQTALKLRNLLFAPGDSTRKAEKALASQADGIILDLEDSVGLPNKDAARATVASLIPTISRPGVFVRINPRGTPQYLPDLAGIVAARPYGIMLPKCTGPHDIAALDHHLEALETASGQEPGRILVLALVTETAASLRDMDYRGAPARLAALCFGAEDLSADLGTSPRAGGAYVAPVAAARAMTLLAAGAAGLPALDTPFPDPRDPAGLAREAADAAADGFAGKLCIHPDQLGPVAAAFTPDAGRRRWAEQVRDGFAARPGEGVFLLDGKMIDRPHLKLAERILAASAT